MRRRPTVLQATDYLWTILAGWGVDADVEPAVDAVLKTKPSAETMDAVTMLVDAVARTMRAHHDAAEE
jgi:hypothetical protein